MARMSLAQLKETIRSIPDWPIKGVIFRDITTLMQDPEAYREACDLFYDRYKDKKIDKIVGIDARGFVFGAVLAYKLGIGFCDHNHERKLSLAGYSGMLNFAREVYASATSPVWQFAPERKHPRNFS